VAVPEQQLETRPYPGTATVLANSHTAFWNSLLAWVPRFAWRQRINAKPGTLYDNITWNQQD